MPVDPMPAPAAPVPAVVELSPLKQEPPGEAIPELPIQTVEDASLASSEVSEPVVPIAPDVSAVVTAAPPVAEITAEPVIEQTPLIAEPLSLEVTPTAKPKRTNNGRKAKTEAA